MSIAGKILRAGGMAKFDEPNYAAMPTWKLEQINQDQMMFGLGKDPAAKTRAELHRRYRKETLDHNWKLLERNGFGM